MDVGDFSFQDVRDAVQFTYRLSHHNDSDTLMKVSLRQVQHTSDGAVRLSNTILNEESWAASLHPDGSGTVCVAAVLRHTAGSSGMNRLRR
jgi:hypothetical protein